MKYHKYCRFFPLMEGEEFKELVADIKENGLREPIVTFEDQILDGRNRYRACKKAGVKPQFRALKAKDALAYVVSMNVHRRHLRQDQKAAIGIRAYKKEAKAQAARRDGGRSGVQWSEITGQLVGVSSRVVERVDRVMREDPEAETDILAGTRSADDIERQVRQREKKKAEAAEKRADKKAYEARKASEAFSAAVKSGNHFVGVIEELRLKKHGRYLSESHSFQLLGVLQDIQQAVSLLSEDSEDLVQRLRGHRDILTSAK